MPESKQPTKQPTSDAFGANAWLVDEMFEQFRRDPLSVSESWREFFEGYKPAGANLAARRARSQMFKHRRTKWRSRLRTAPAPGTGPVVE